MSAPSQLTYSAILLAVFANQICLPIPSIVFLMAAGALSAHGEMRNSIVVFLSVLARLAADGAPEVIADRLGVKFAKPVIGLN